MIVRPGPASIDPGQAPGGIVLHVYDVPSSTLLLTRRLTSYADAEGHALEDADFVTAMTTACCLVAYDGDTGRRMPLDVFGAHA